MQTTWLNSTSHVPHVMAAQSPYIDLSKEMIEFWADYCWKMTQYWFSWHSFWLNLLQNVED